MRHWIPLFTIFLIPGVFSTTEEMSTEYCYGDPASPIHVEGARVYAVTDIGSKVCYFRPIQGNYYISVRIDRLNLEAIGNTCPTFTLSTYSRIIIRPGNQADTMHGVQDMFVFPDDLQVQLAADCNNYTSLIGKSFQSVDAGYKLEMKYNPHTYSAPKNAYSFTITPYQLGQSFVCPDTYFRCWSNKYMCIPESLECDGVDNCFDNSDEENYKCTGKIGILPLPLFIIIIVVAFLVLIIILANIILCLRARRRKQAQKFEMIQDMNISDRGALQFHDYNPDAMSEPTGQPYV